MMNHFTKFLFSSISLLSLLLLVQSCSDSTSTNSNGDTASSASGNFSKKDGRSKSGYLYELYTKETGEKPVVGDEVKYHELVFKNDSLVKSTMLQFEPIVAVLPTADKVASPPPPTYDALFLMSPGDSLITYHVLDTFKNYQLPGWLSPRDTLIYTLKLLSVRSKTIIEQEKAAIMEQEKTVATATKALISDFNAGKLDQQLATTENGIRYIIHEPGEGEKAKDKQFVKVNYSGFLLDGTPFDNSFQKGVQFPFQLGRGSVIKGWEDAVPQLAKGGKGTFFIPYQLAYGEAGRPPAIPEKSDLVFYIELVDVFVR